MSRFASAPWPLRAAYVGSLGLLGLAALVAIALLVALAGLHQLSVHVRADAVLPWFWYFRRDPEVLRWLKVGALVALVCGGATAIGVSRSLGYSLYGDARWAGAADIARAGLRARHGILLGRASGQPLVFGGSEHVLLHSLSESDHRRALMLPQELIQMPPDRLIVLKAGSPPVRGRKITYHRERQFRTRLLPAPRILPRARPSAAATPSQAPTPDPTDGLLSLDIVAATLASADLQPLPPVRAADAEIERWVDRFLETTAARDPETRHVR
ncbi:MAG TPA: type IV secretory system conjugative DNA transfer family protein [Phenylobacterium sp.]